MLGVTFTLAPWVSLAFVFRKLPDRIVSHAASRSSLVADRMEGRQLSQRCARARLQNALRLEYVWPEACTVCARSGRDGV